MNLDRLSKKINLFMAPFAVVGIPISIFNILLIGDHSWYNYYGIVCYPFMIKWALDYIKELKK